MDSEELRLPLVKNEEECKQTAASCVEQMSGFRCRPEAEMTAYSVPRRANLRLQR